MSLITLIIVIAAVGILLYLVQLVPMEATVKKILNVVVIIFLIIWLLKYFGVWSQILSLRI